MCMSVSAPQVLVFEDVVSLHVGIKPEFFSTSALNHRANAPAQRHIFLFYFNFMYIGALTACLCEGVRELQTVVSPSVLNHLSCTNDKFLTQVLGCNCYSPTLTPTPTPDGAKTEFRMASAPLLNDHQAREP